MSIITTYPFDNTANYDKVNTEVSSGAGRLSLVDKAALTFLEDFLNDTGFTYDAAKTEFVGGVIRQKSQRPANATAGATYTTDLDLSWGDGSLAVVSSVGSPTVTGGKLDLTGTNQQVVYNPISKINPRKGSVKWKYTHKFAGTPSAVQQFFLYQETGAILNHRTFIELDTANTFRVTVTDSAGTGIMTAESFAVKVLTLDQEYVFEWRYDYTTSSERQELFIDGVQQGSTQNKVATMNDDVASVGYLRIGGFAGAKYLLDDLYFSTSDAQDENYVVPEKDYLTDTIDIPNFTYTDNGLIQSIELLAATEADSPRYTIEGKYWNGSAWVSSDGSYAQANNKATVNTNINALDVLGQSVISMQIVWPDSNVFASVDDLTLTYTGQEYAAEGSLLTNVGVIAKDIISFLATEVKPVNTDIKYIIDVNSQDYYHNGSAWVVSDGTNSQANTLVEVQTNIADLLTVNSTVKIKTVLTSDGSDTSEIDLLTIAYDFGALEPTDPTQAQVYGYLKDIENNPIANASVSVTPNRASTEYTEAADRIVTKTVTKVTDANGFFSFNLIISDDYEVVGIQKMQYVLSILLENEAAGSAVSKNGLQADLQTAKTILFEVPNQPTVNITAQIGAV